MKKRDNVFVIPICLFMSLLITSIALPQQLTQPFLTLSKPQVDSLAFPEENAGISAYVKVSQTIDVNRLSPIFKEVKDIGDNYIIGIVPIQDIGGDIDVHLYADAEGWFVAYLLRTEASASIMQWLVISDIKNPVITNINRTVLTDALDEAENQLRLQFSDITYYHFKYPQATEMILFVKTLSWYEDSDIVQFKIPQNFTLYEASFYHYLNSDSGIRDSKVKIDGFLVSDLPETATSQGRNYDDDSFRNIDFYQESYVTLNILHTIEVIHKHLNSASGLASVLIYKQGE